MRGMGHTGDQVQGRRTEDEYGNPIHHAGGGAFPTDIGGTTGYVSTNDTSGAFPADIGATTGHGMTGTHASDMGTGYGGTDQGQQQQHRGGHHVVRLEKLPGGHKDDQMTSTTTTGEHGHEKKGIIEKIKEKLPGGHND